MHITQIDVMGVRNITNISLSPFKSANFIYGVNGSGKTSLLESIYLLSRGKSFRSRDIRTVISESLSECIVHARINIRPETHMSLGLRRNVSGMLEAKKNGERIKTSSELASLFPIQVIDSSSFNLIDGSPSYRRKFLDWGVFHVEPAYASVWNKHQKALKQRNQLLRYGTANKDELNVWNAELDKLNGLVTAYRERYISNLSDSLCESLSRYDQINGIQIEYEKGWPSGKNFIDVLQDFEASDRKLGHTSHGAHKADLSITLDGVKVRDKFSRGQIKLLVYALQLAQGEIHKQNTGIACAYVLDDLPSELDEVNRELVFSHLFDLNCQFFVTGVDKLDFMSHLKEKTCKMFHMEQGFIQEIN